jgi:hypothetical protein
VQVTALLDVETRAPVNNLSKDVARMVARHQQYLALSDHRSSASG